MTFKMKTKDRDRERERDGGKSRSSTNGSSKSRDKERDKKSSASHSNDSKERTVDRGTSSTKERHRSRSRERSSERAREGRRSKERHRRHSRPREESRERDHRRREHRERRSRSRSRDRKHRSHEKEGHRSREQYEGEASRAVERPRQEEHEKEYDYKGIEFTQNVMASMMLTAATANDFAKLLNTYNQQQQIQQQQQQIQTQQALFELQNENSCSSIGSKGENGGVSTSHTNGHSSGGEGESSRKRKRKSRWAGGDHDKTFIPGMPTVLPSTMTPDQQEAYLVQLQIEEISRKLRTGDLMIPQNPEERSPSPEPIYSSDGKRLNTREFRTRKKLEEQRHQLIQRMQSLNPDFKPPSDYKPPVIRVSDKVLIPQEEHPDINFVGLLIGPRGNTLKAMEKDTGAKIIIRGKGSVKEGKVGRKDGQPLPGEDEPLHAFITASNPEAVKKAVDRIKDVIRQGIEVPEGHNDLRRMQLRELAQLNGTLRETDGPRCNNCGSNEHKSWLCPDKPNITNNIVCSACGGTGHIARDCRSKRPGHGGPPGAGSNVATKIDEEYMSLMAELGEAPPQNDHHHHGGGGGGGGGYRHEGGGSRGSYNLFEPRSAPRPLMSTPHHPPSLMGSGSHGAGGGSHHHGGSSGGGGSGSSSSSSSSSSSNHHWGGHHHHHATSTTTQMMPTPPAPPALPTPPPPPPGMPSLLQWTAQPPIPPGSPSDNAIIPAPPAPVPPGSPFGGNWTSKSSDASGGSLLASPWSQASPGAFIPSPPGPTPPPPPLSAVPAHILPPPPPPPPTS